MKDAIAAFEFTVREAQRVYQETVDEARAVLLLEIQHHVSTRRACERQEKPE